MKHPNEDPDVQIGMIEIDGPTGELVSRFMNDNDVPAKKKKALLSLMMLISTDAPNEKLVEHLDVKDLLKKLLRESMKTYAMESTMYLLMGPVRVAVAQLLEADAFSKLPHEEGEKGRLRAELCLRAITRLFTETAEELKELAAKDSVVIPEKEFGEVFAPLVKQAVESEADGIQAMIREAVAGLTEKEPTQKKKDNLTTFPAPSSSAIH